jgi:hypothetical protein
VSPGQAKISIKRESEESLAFDRAQVAINGTPTADIGKGQSYAGGIPAGPVTLTVGVDGAIGHYTLRFTAVPGKAYAFLIERRPEYAFSQSFQGGYLSYALNDPTSEQSGPYKITLINP